MSAVINPTNVIFFKGYLYATIAGGVADGIPLAELQDIEVNTNMSLEELMGPSQLTATGVALKERKVSGKAKAAKFRANHLKMLFGSTPAYSSSTTVNIGVNDEPVKFNLHLKSPSDGTELELKLYGCVATAFDLKMALNNFVIPEFAFNVYGDGTNVMQYILPGDQTTS